MRIIVLEPGYRTNPLVENALRDCAQLIAQDPLYIASCAKEKLKPRLNINASKEHFLQKHWLLGWIKR
jgi:hypothetical protein